MYAPSISQSFHRLKQPPVSLAFDVAQSYKFSYFMKALREDDSAQCHLDVIIVIALRYHQEIPIRNLLLRIKECGLYDKTMKIFLRFEEDPNRRIVNLCKLNYDKVEIHSSSDFDVFDFINTKIVKPHLEITKDHPSFENNQLAVLSYDLRDERYESISQLLGRHTIDEWMYCLCLLMKPNHVRSIGLFPNPSTNVKESRECYWFNTFWLRIDLNTMMKQHQESITCPSLYERASSLQCSRTNLFQSTDEIVASRFEYDDEDEQILELDRNKSC